MLSQKLLFKEFQQSMKILILEISRLHGLAMCLNNSHRLALAAVHTALLCTYVYIYSYFDGCTIKSCVWLAFFKCMISADKFQWLQELLILVFYLYVN